ncbi:type II secretion system F family protein [Bacillus sp. FJAT-27245]|uniref:type II secretion system F family protein n=1 Tax=Bacillus sp. FJAT-27245 TaxID=1684144 RepID=UPI0006A7CF20|nr:type II secretion system F family protein [Bacillus sp. FJAT-27245]
MIEWSLYVLAFLSLTLTYRAFLQYFYRSELIINERVEGYFPKGQHHAKSSRTSEKAIKPFAAERVNAVSVKMKEYLSKRLTREAKSELERKLREAGLPYSWSAVDFRLLQVLIGTILFVTGYMLFGKGSEKTLNALFLSLSFGALGYYYPSFYLSVKKKHRLKKIQKSLADFFDMVNLSVEAGMGLDAAIMRVCKNMKGPLAEEFMLALEEMRLGKSRKEAFINLRSRISLDAFQSLMTSLIQADQLGIGMSKVLKALTERIREHQRQLAREQAMKAPIKMMFPMVMFIFPAIFIVLLGPLVIYLLQFGLGG